MPDQMHIELVTWIDSSGCTAAWTELEELVAYGPCTGMKSVGYLAKETETYIVLVPHLGGDMDQGCGEMAIPKVAITSRHELTEGT